MFSKLSLFFFAFVVVKIIHATPTINFSGWNTTEGMQAISLSSSVENHCALLVSGALKCWGDNNYDSIGVGATNFGVPRPTSPISATTNITLFSVGGGQLCYLQSGVVKCVGANYNGQLGDGTNTDTSSPVSVIGLSSNITFLGSGSGHSCAVQNGAAKCWGGNVYSQLGIASTTTTTSAPVQVTGLTSNVTAISAGTNHSCAVHNGAAKCWGDNTTGLLGSGLSITGSASPVQVVGLTSNVSAVVTGVNHSCAIHNGAAKCWGDNSKGQLGNSTTTASSAPVQVTGLTSGVTKIAVADKITCAVHNSAAKCWGNSADGHMGNGLAGANYVVSAPVQVTGLTSGVTDVSVARSACAVHFGRVKCWGKYNLGAEKYSTYTTVPKLIYVSGTISQASAGAINSCFVTTAGAAKCAGSNFFGGVGNASIYETNTLQQATGLTANVSQTSVGFTHACAVHNGAAKCWGLNTNGQVGNSTTSLSVSAPVQTTGLTSNVSFISAGNTHSCAVHNGVAKCWGFNIYGKLGDSSTTQRTSPVSVTGLTSNVTMISAGEYSSCAVHNGAAKCWGFNDYGQLGIASSTASSSAPVQVTGLTSNVTAISVGIQSSPSVCAVHNGAAKCWGRNQYGQLGDGTITDNAVPVQVTGLTSGVTAISTYSNTFCAIHNGAAKCWGYNGSMLGDGTLLDSSTPVQVSGLTSGVTSINVGFDGVCAIHNGELKCWGNIEYVGRKDISGWQFTPVPTNDRGH